MAAATGERFDGKLDAVLRRELPLSDYERIVATEVCIQVSHKGKKAHGHVIIGPSHLYFAVIPVKHVQSLLKLSDVVSMTTVDDQPDFLSDKNKDHSVHLVINYKTQLTTSSMTHSQLAITEEENRVAFTLHLYLLQIETLFVSYLSHHIEDIQILLMEQNRRKYSTHTLDKQGTTERYHSLKADILSARSIEDSAKLYLELSTALDSYFQIKLIFWQDNGQLLQYCLEDMERKVYSSLVDTLEYKVIITEVILKAFQYTLVSKNKIVLLTQNNAQTITDISNHLLNSFVTPIEDVKLLDELAVNCSGILFEISRVIQQQMSWKCNPISTSSISSWCITCERHPGLSVFLNRVVEVLCVQVDSGFYYRIISLLLVWVTYCPSILTFCRQKFKEEFHYSLVQSTLDIALVATKLRQLRTIILN